MASAYSGGSHPTTGRAIGSARSVLGECHRRLGVQRMASRKRLGRNSHPRQAIGAQPAPTPTPARSSRVQRYNIARSCEWRLGSLERSPTVLEEHQRSLTLSRPLHEPVASSRRAGCTLNYTTIPLRLCSPLLCVAAANWNTY